MSQEKYFCCVWVKVFKNGAKFCKGYLSKILLGPFLNPVSHMQKNWHCQYVLQKELLIILKSLMCRSSFNLIQFNLGLKLNLKFNVFAALFSFDKKIYLPSKVAYKRVSNLVIKKKGLRHVCFRRESCESVQQSYAVECLLSPLVSSVFEIHPLFVQL